MKAEDAKLPGAGKAEAAPKKTSGGKGSSTGLGNNGILKPLQGIDSEERREVLVPVIRAHG